MTWVATVQVFISALIGLIVFTAAAVAVAAPKVLANARDIDALWQQFRTATTTTATGNRPLGRASSVEGVDPHGGGATQRGATLAASIPRWSQRTDPNPNGSLPTERFNDCGEECIAMIYRSTRGVEVEADYLRFLIHGPTGSGITSADDLDHLLKRAFYAPSVKGLAAPEALTYLVQATVDRRPVVALGTWVSLGFQHWVVVMSIAGDIVTYMDPWFGAPVAIGRAAFSERYRGTLVDCGESAAYPP